MSNSKLFRQIQETYDRYWQKRAIAEDPLYTPIDHLLSPEVLAHINAVHAFLYYPDGLPVSEEVFQPIKKLVQLTNTLNKTEFPESNYSMELFDIAKYLDNCLNKDNAAEHPKEWVNYFWRLMDLIKCIIIEYPYDNSSLPLMKKEQHTKTELNGIFQDISTIEVITSIFFKIHYKNNKSDDVLAIDFPKCSRRTRKTPELTDRWHLIKDALYGDLDNYEKRELKKIRFKINESFRLFYNDPSIFAINTENKFPFPIIITGEEKNRYRNSAHNDLEHDNTDYSEEFTDFR